MKKRTTSFFLALIMLLQFALPQNIFAEEDKSLPHDKNVKMGEINSKSYGAKMMLELNKLTARNKKSNSAKPGVSLFGYFEDGNEPSDTDKPKYYGNVKAIFKVNGLDGNDFQWNEIFGVDDQGNQKPAQLVFSQINDNTGDETGVERILKVTATGEYTWTDGAGNPAELPLFNNNLEPLIYEVRVDEEVSEKVKLLTANILPSEDASPTFEQPDADGRVKFNLVLQLELNQVASTKFKSEWHTGVTETQRPQVQGTIIGKEEGIEEEPVNFDLPKNDTDIKIIRDWDNSFEEGLILPEYLYETPTVRVNETNTADLTFDTTGKIVKSGDHKYRYKFAYNVIDGGKLTMTEMLSVTFDANGGKFENFTVPDTNKKIVKEVDYGKDLTDMAEDPTKDRETFKGWSETKGGTTPVTAEFFKNIKEAKTLYAIWDNNDIVTEQLEVKESFKDGDAWVNDFIPTLDTLKGQVKIKDGNGTPQALEATDTFEILNDGGTAITGDDLKNYLYEKLQEKDNPNDEPTRVETVKAKITHANGTSKTVEIPIKVFKNIYEAKTLTEKPFYVPADYVKVTLDPTTKAKEPQKTYYYVNPKAKVVIPGKDPEGKGDNKFVKWTIGDTEYKLSERHQFDNETIIEAQYVSDVIPGNPDGSKPDTVPENYVKVSFVLVPEIGGEIGGTFEKDAITVYYVNPEKEVTITQPETIADIGYEFKKWDQDTTAAKKYVENTTVKGSFRELKNIIPATNDDGTSNNQPEGYVTVTFTDGVEGKVHGKITSGKTVYYVNPKANKQLKHLVLDSYNRKNRPIVTPDVGYEFTGWLQGNNYYIVEDVTVPAEYEAIDDVIPKTNDDGKENEKPYGYVTLTFDKGDHGKEITGQTVYYVNPKADPAKTVGDALIKKPEVKAEIGWKQKAGADAWDTADTFEIKADKTVKAQYDSIADVIPQEKEDGTDKPDGYLTVTFSTEKDGKIKDTTDTKTKVVYVNPNKAVVLKGEAPEVTPNAGFEFTGWDTQIEKAIQYKDNDVIKAKYKTIVDVVPQEGENKPEGVPENFVKVTFVPTEKGTMEGAKIFWVNPEVKVTIPVKDPVGATYFKFDKWKLGEKADGADYTPSVETQFKENTTITATYEEAKNIIPYNPEEPITRPDGYVRVTFAADPGLKLTEQKAYYVKKNAKITLKAIKDDTTNYGYPGVTANTGYKFKEWDKGDDTVINADIVVTAKATKLDNVIPEKDANGKTNEKPTGYVQVTVDPTDEATDPATKVFWVNPNEVVQIPAEKPTGKKDGETTYVFYDWDRSLVGQFTEDTTITATYKKQTPQTPIFAPYVSTGVVATDLNKQPLLDAYKDQIKSDKDFELVDIVEQPKVNKSGFTSAKIKIRFTENGMTKVVDVLVYVKPDPVIIEKPYPVPGDCNNSCDQPNKPNQPNIGMDALNTKDHYQYLIGYPDGNFAPNRGMTRAEVATMFTRLLKERPVKGQRYYTGFSDIQDGDWYANTVGYAVQVGIVSGYPDGSFKPNKPITRSEFASIASRFDALAQGNDIAFNDLAPSHWGYNAIRSAATKGWISGYPDNTFRPEKAISRAEVTSITNRMLNRYADLYWIDAHRGEVIRFGDVNRGDWYFEPIMEATMGHDFIRDRDGKTEHWTGLNGKSFI